MHLAPPIDSMLLCGSASFSTIPDYKLTGMIVINWRCPSHCASLSAVDAWPQGCLQSRRCEADLAKLLEPKTNRRRKARLAVQVAVPGYPSYIQLPGVAYFLLGTTDTDATYSFRSR